MKRALLFAAMIFLTIAGAAWAQSTQHSVALSWSSSDTGVTFNVYRLAGACPASLSGTAPYGFTKIASAIVPLTYTDTSVASAGSTYCYYVTEYIAATSSAAAQESAPSNLAGAVIPLGKVTITITLAQ